ncbi:unnamed protein product [Orchesella dallaii]|uniref:Uncharacterized protein n=1 Tax=Orchesella dallaii TaxID=48710 RepID=A0ABP1QRN5_9HEXA
MGRLLISVCCIILLYQQLATCIPAPKEAETAPAAAAEKAPAAAAEKAPAAAAEKAPAAESPLVNVTTNGTDPDGRSLLGIDIGILDFSKNKKSQAVTHHDRPRHRYSDEYYGDRHDRYDRYDDRRDGYYPN